MFPTGLLKCRNSEQFARWGLCWRLTPSTELKINQTRRLWVGLASRTAGERTHFRTFWGFGTGVKPFLDHLPAPRNAEWHRAGLPRGLRLRVVLDRGGRSCFAGAPTAPSSSRTPARTAMKPRSWREVGSVGCRGDGSGGDRSRWGCCGVRVMRVGVSAVIWSLC